MKVKADVNNVLATCIEIMHLDKEVVPIKYGYKLGKKNPNKQNKKTHKRCKNHKTKVTNTSHSLKSIKDRTSEANDLSYKLDFN